MNSQQLLTRFQPNFMKSRRAYRLPVMVRFFLELLSFDFRQNVELRNQDCYIPFWEVFAHFLVEKGLIRPRKIGANHAYQTL